MMKKIIRVLVLVCIVVCCCTACDKNMEGTTITTIQTEEICASYDPIAMEEPFRLLLGEISYHNGYLYFPEHDDHGYHIFKRMNLTTGEISSPCIDPLCSHDTAECPFLCGELYVARLRFYDEWVLIQSNFSASPIYDEKDKADHSGGYYKNILYNTETGEWNEVFQENLQATGYSVQAVRVGSYLYKTTYGAPRTVNGETIYPTNIQRYHFETGKEETIYSHDYFISLVAAGEKRVYFGEIIDRNYRFYSVDLNGENFREEPNMVIEGAYVYKNRAYGNNSSDSYDYHLYVNDFATGEMTPIADNYMITGISIYEDQLYYLVKDYYSQYFSDAQAINKKAREAGFRASVDEPYKSELDEVKRKYKTSMVSLWRCDLDGNNKELILELPGASGTMNLYIWDGYIYTEYVFYDTETGEPLGTEEEIGRPCRIDLTTGEVEFLHKLGAE